MSFSFLIGKVTPLSSSNVQAAQQLRNLAVEIFIALAGRNALDTHQDGRNRHTAEDLARLSFELAECFQRIEHELISGVSVNNDTYELKTSDLTSWGE